MTANRQLHESLAIHSHRAAGGDCDTWNENASPNKQSFLPAAPRAHVPPWLDRQSESWHRHSQNASARVADTHLPSRRWYHRGVLSQPHSNKPATAPQRRHLIKHTQRFLRQLRPQSQHKIGDCRRAAVLMVGAVALGELSCGAIAFLHRIICQRRLHNRRGISQYRRLSADG